MAIGRSIAIGKSISAAGSLFEGEATAQASKYNAGVLRLNATLTRQNAAESERRFRRMSKKRMGSMRTAAGASGFALTGSALDAMADSAMQEELDALTLRYEGELKARSYEQEAVMADYKAKTARTGAFINALGSLF